MLDVFICHSPLDREVAAAIAARLERGAEATVWLEECQSQTENTVASAWDGGLSSGAILLLLAPEAVPERLSRESWEPLLKHVESHAAPPVGAVLVRDCQYPRPLERKHFFRWSDGVRETLRAVERWTLSLHSEDAQPPFAPARLPWFQGREPELHGMWEALVDEAGVVALVNPAPGSGKTTLAQQFANAAGGHFRDILWVGCGDRSEASILGDLGAQLGGGLLARALEEHRLLLVFDDLAGDPPIIPPAPGRASLLITSRSGSIGLPPHARVMPMESNGPPEPAELPPDSPENALWQAVSVCRPHGFPLALAAWIATLDQTEAREACQQLVAKRWVDPFDAGGARFRMGAGALAASRPELQMFRRRHAETLLEIFSEWRAHPDHCRESLCELESAIQWALRTDWELANGLAERGLAFLKHEERWPEVAELYTKIRQAARERQDSRVVENCTWELSWLQDERGEIRRPPAPGDQLVFGW